VSPTSDPATAGGPAVAARQPRRSADRGRALSRRATGQPDRVAGDVAGDEQAGPLAGPRGEDDRARTSRRRRLVRLVFGDWHPLLRDPLDLLRLSFGVAAVLFFLAGSLEYGVRLAGTFLLLVVAQRVRLPRLFDFLFIVGMALQAWGNAGRLFEDISWWDNLVHFVIPATSVPVLYVVQVRLGLLPPMAEARRPRQRLGFVLFAVTTGIAIGAIYEIYEYVANRWLGAPIAIGYADTIFDLTLNAGGALLGGLVLMLWSAERWSSERGPIR
jgi:hypothetical protein